MHTLLNNNLCLYILCRANKYRWNKRPPPPHNLTATKGSVHIVANRDFVDFALHNQKAKDLLAWVKKVPVPDECFFATLNHNPSLRVRGAYLGELTNATRVKSGKFGLQVNSDTHLQTAEIQMRRLLISSGFLPVFLDSLFLFQ